MAENVVGEVDNTVEAKMAALQAKYERIKQEKEKFAAMNNTLLRILHCRECTVYLSGQVFMCPKGHNFCPNCDLNILRCTICLDAGPRARNISLEMLANEVLHPCSYKDEGCKIYFLNEEWHNQLAHEATCDYKLTCKFHVRFSDSVALPCLWRGKIRDVKDHCRRNHPESVVLAVNEHTFRVSLPKTSQGYYYKNFLLSSANNDVFLIRFFYHQDRKLFVPHALYMGKKENLGKFKILFRFGKRYEKVLSTTPLNCLDHVSISKLIADMPHLDHKMIAVFSENNAIKCLVTIQRV